MALRRRYWSHDTNSVFIAQSNVAGCLDSLGRFEEALVLEREIYARHVAKFGVLHEGTIVSGLNLSITLNKSKRWGEGLQFVRDLLPEARKLLGADHDATLDLNQNLAAAIVNGSNGTRDDLRLNQHLVALGGARS